MQHFRKSRIVPQSLKVRCAELLKTICVTASEISLVIVKSTWACDHSLGLPLSFWISLHSQALCYTNMNASSTYWHVCPLASSDSILNYGIILIKWKVEINLVVRLVYHSSCSQHTCWIIETGLKPLKCVLVFSRSTTGHCSCSAYWGCLSAYQAIVSYRAG